MRVQSCVLRARAVICEELRDGSVKFGTWMDFLTRRPGADRQIQARSKISLKSRCKATIMVRQEARFTECVHKLSRAREQHLSRSRLPTFTMIVLGLLLLGLASCPPSIAAAAAAGRDSDDVACLREFKEAVTDPLGYLGNWDFRGRDINICNFIGVTCVGPDEPKVQKLDLTAAGLGGRISSTLFRKCSSLRELNLSNNFFTGRVPPTICVHNRNLVALDVSNNGFSGPLSPNLQRCLESNKRLIDSQLSEEISYISIELPSDADGRDDQ